MQYVLVKKPLYLYSASFTFISSFRRLLSTSLPSAQAATLNPPVESPFAAVDYLVKSCGLPMEKAIKASKYISHLKSPSKPDSVLQFLRESGFSDADITRAVSPDPRLLCVNLETIMKPRIAEMQKIGFTPSQIAQLVSFSPRTVTYMPSGSLQKSIEFLTTFFGSFEGILNAVRKAQYLLTVSPEKVIEPNISFLQEHCGLSPNQIGKMIVSAPAVFTMNPNTLDAKIKKLKNIGFSKEEIDSMIKKQPMLLVTSDEKIRSSIDFLTSEAGFDLPYIAFRPVLISFSLEKRIIPQHSILKSLESKSLIEKSDFYTTMCTSGERFYCKFVRPYKDIIPEVCEAFESACAGKISLKWKFLDTPRKIYSVRPYKGAKLKCGYDLCFPAAEED